MRIGRKTEGQKRDWIRSGVKGNDPSQFSIEVGHWEKSEKKQGCVGLWAVLGVVLCGEWQL